MYICVCVKRKQEREREEWIEICSKTTYYWAGEIPTIQWTKIRNGNMMHIQNKQTFIALTLCRNKNKYCFNILRCPSIRRQNKVSWYILTWLDVTVHATELLLFNIGISRQHYLSKKSNCMKLFESSLESLNLY